jgi:hypothetical protein
MKLISEFLRSPGEILQGEHRQKILIILTLIPLFVCIPLTLSRITARQRKLAAELTAITPRENPVATNTKWWAKKNASAAPINTVNLENSIGTPPITTAPAKCPAYAADFKPGTYGYISPVPPHENFIRSGAGMDYSRVGSIEVGGWVKILDLPVCADGYVWLNVQSAGSSSSWTAGGRRNTQWVIPCSDPSRKCSNQKKTRLLTSTPKPDGGDIQTDDCKSDRLSVGLDAQVSPDDLLVVRAEPYTGSVLGRVPPAAGVVIIEGPKCAGGVIWWMVTSNQVSGWVVESLLKPCPEEGECKPWE